MSEAFYSTKDVGSGTGLGLDTARRIGVERHAGTIDIESDRGAMILRVTLPVRYDARTGRQLLQSEPVGERVVHRRVP